MHHDIYQELTDRGFIYQATHEDELRGRLTGGPPLTFYIGFDPTADSLHVGSLIPLIAMVHMQRAGHRPIALVGGGTALVGDPSGKTEMRRLLSRTDIDTNARGLREQMGRFLTFGDDGGLLLNNADWLEDLRYIDFLRDIGRHFSVNRMLTAESYRQRLETGLSFIEFNYMLLQAYDFHVLCRGHDCILQMGGQDQWGNIVAGVDLVRRLQSREVYGITFPLLTTAGGEKFGKTAAGAIWLDAGRTSVFDFYQFWRNCEDGEIGRLLRLFTFLPAAEIGRLETNEDHGINRAKEILAYEVTALVHGHEAAADAFRAAATQFGTADPEGRIETSSRIAEITAGRTPAASLPETSLSPTELDAGLTVVDLFVRAGLCASKGAARRLLDQGGGYCNDDRLQADFTITATHFSDGALLLRAGKKRYHRFVLRP
ncbi:MAG: tyrosine--tRNA ligase [Deltaproteobacteria bacterium]|nr:tyrosine--tRNA ligase [Candidatus Anaeroferrophillacea bacterium]